MSEGWKSVTTSKGTRLLFVENIVSIPDTLTGKYRYQGEISLDGERRYVRTMNDSQMMFYVGEQVPAAKDARAEYSDALRKLNWDYPTTPKESPSIADLT